MEPLSAAASIIAVMQLSGTIISYLSDVKGAPKELPRIRSEICSTIAVLGEIQTKADEAQQDNSWSSTLQVLNGPNGPLRQMQTILQGLEKKLATASGWRRKIGPRITWHFDKPEIQNTLSAIGRQNVLISVARGNDHIALTKRIRSDLQSMQFSIDNISSEVSNLHVEKIRTEIHDWLNAPDPSTNYNKALEACHENTGDWFIQSGSYLHWLSTPNTLLWLYGIPGCGKTILSSKIIHQTLGSFRSRLGSAVMYFYFDFNETGKQQHESMIRSLISQLSTHSEKTSAVLGAFHSSNTHGKQQPTSQALLENFHGMLTACDEPIIILDALDECEEMEDLLNDIKEITAWPDAKTRILVTSREKNDIKDVLSNLAGETGMIRIQSSLVDQDIRAYTQFRLLSDPKLKRWQDERQKITEKLMEKAHGMFRWAACQLDELRSCRSKEQLDKALDSLPRTLDATYERILCKIGESDRPFARKILQWLAFSARPLTLDEIAEVTGIDIDSSPMYSTRRRLQDANDALEICSSLVTTTYEPLSSRAKAINVVRLAHYSVKEYLFSDRIQTGLAMAYSLQHISSNECLANDCIAYISQIGQGPFTSVDAIFVEYPLLVYATNYWDEHAFIAEQSTERAIRFSRYLWEDPQISIDLRRLNPNKLIRYSTPLPPLLYAIARGLIGTVKVMIDEGVPVNRYGESKRSPLEQALLSNRLLIMKFFLDHGANWDTERFFPLGEASRRGHQEIVKFLLVQGADVNGRDKNGKSALLKASEGRHIAVASLLIQSGADVNIHSNDANTALLEASERGDDDMIRLLVQSGADVNHRHESGNTALINSSGNGNVDIVRLLLQSGADVNPRGYLGNTALIHASVDGGHVNVIRLLLQNGADVDARNDYGNTALIEGLSMKKVIDILLQSGADVNARNNEGDSALIRASARHLHDVVRLLLSSGADVNFRSENKYYGAAIEAATGGFTESIFSMGETVALLLSAGSEITPRFLRNVKRHRHDESIMQMLSQHPNFGPAKMELLNRTEDPHSPNWVS